METVKDHQHLKKASDIDQNKQKKRKGTQESNGGGWGWRRWCRRKEEGEKIQFHKNRMQREKVKQEIKYKQKKFNFNRMTGR